VDFVFERMRRTSLSEASPDDFMAAVFRDMPSGSSRTSPAGR
jgi:hypothetical protein